MAEPPAPHAPAGDDPLSYGEAVAELDQIMAELDADDVDVDRLAERVARAAALIRFCRERIAGTRMEVERIVAGLDADEPSPEP